MSQSQHTGTQVFVVWMWDDSDHSASGAPHWKGRVKYLIQDGEKTADAANSAESLNNLKDFEEKAFNTMDELVAHLTHWLERAHARARGSRDRPV